jgi:hypothetical protein
MSRVQAGSSNGPGVVAVPSSADPSFDELHWTGWRRLRSLEGLRGEARAAAHRANIADRQRDLEDFRAFCRQLRERLQRCTTDEERIALGQLLRPEVPLEPGATRAERTDFMRIQEEFTGETRGVLAEVGRTRARLEGRREPLDARLELKVGLRIDGGSGTCGVGATLDGGIDAGCRAPAGGAAGIERDGRASRSVAAGTASVTFVGDRIESVELAHGGAYGRVGRSSVAIGLGGQRAVSAPGAKVTVSVEARVGVDVQLLDRETVRRALSPENRWAK